MTNVAYGIAERPRRVASRTNHEPATRPGHGPGGPGMRSPHATLPRRDSGWDRSRLPPLSHPHPRPASGAYGGRRESGPPGLDDLLGEKGRVAEHHLVAAGHLDQPVHPEAAGHTRVPGPLPPRGGEGLRGV